jgi:hypothetical protein
MVGHSRSEQKECLGGLGRQRLEKKRDGEGRNGEDDLQRGCGGEVGERGGGSGGRLKRHRRRGIP